MTSYWILSSAMGIAFVPLILALILRHREKSKERR